jgi:F-type H+-transporting ATPase subunit delta
MTSGTAAGRYARALFDVARQEQGDVEAIDRQLADFMRVLTTNDTLLRALTNPAVAIGKKRGVVDALLSHAPGMSPILMKTIRMLADRDRLALLPQIASAYDARLMDHRRVVRAQVITAMELPPDRIDWRARQDVRFSSPHAWIRRSSVARSPRLAARFSMAASRVSWRNSRTR